MTYYEFEHDVDLGRREDALSEWAKSEGLDPMAITLYSPFYYNDETSEIEYSELSDPRHDLEHVGQVLTRKRKKVNVPPPLQWFRPLP